MQRSNRAFTLIELLVVIAIIAILAAILFPVFAQAKMAAKKTQALSNMRQTGMGSLLYSNDADDTAPSNGEGMAPSSTWGAWTPITPWTGLNNFNGTNYGGGANAPLGFMDPLAIQNWGAETAPYIKSMDMLTSPAAQNDTSPGLAPVKTAGAGKTSFVMNGCVSSKSLTAASKPADLIVFQPRATTVREAVTLPRLNGFSDGTTKANDSDNAWIGFGFNKGDNYAFGDGHAKYQTRNSVRFKELGYWEWVNVNGVWKDPATNPTMIANPGPTGYFDDWGAWGNCDPVQVP